MLRSLVVSGVLASSTFTVACGTSQDGDTVTPEARAVERVRGVDREAARMLARVPADTPYVWLNAEPLPSAYVDRLAPLADATLAAWDRALDAPLAGEDPEAVALARAFRGHLTREGLQELGFATNPRVLVHGLGLAPVLRLELRDGTAVARLLERVDAADGAIEVRSIDGHPVWTSGADAGVVAGAVAVVGDELVIAVYPPAAEELVLAQAIGSDPPRESLLHSDWLRDARRDHGLLPHGLGMVDVSRTLAILAGEGDATTRAVTRAWATALADDACAIALREWTARAPWVWFGLRDIDARGLETATIWELDEGLRDDVRAIVAPIAGLGRSDRDDGLASFAIGIDAAAAIATFDRWRADDRLRACEGLGSDADTSVPPWLDGVEGGSAVLRDWDPVRERASGAVVLGVGEPLAWLQAVMPTADRNALHRSGRAVALAKVLAVGSSEWLRDAWVARGRHALGLAVGDGARRNVRRAVGHERDDRHTLMSWSLDIPGLLAVVPRSKIRAALAARDAGERATLEAWLDLVGAMRGTIGVGDHGLEITASLELQR